MRDPGVRQFDRLVAAYKEMTVALEDRQRVTLIPSSAVHALKTFKLFTAALEDLETKRIVFDCHQAALFDSLEEGPPADGQAKLRTPFQQFYLEFSEPIVIGAQEPGHNDTAIGFLYMSDVMQTTPVGRDGIQSFDQVTMFLRGDDGSMVDRTWKVALPAGIAVTNVRACQEANESGDPSELPPDLPPGTYFVAGATLPGAEGRRVGWWEGTIRRYTGLVSWCLAYMMAKSVTLEEEWPSRQQRRWLERHGKVPRPWHVVTLDPKIVRAWQDMNFGQEPAYRQSIRYDVIGHLRFNKHWKANGETGEKVARDTVEWVPPHQRGLANELYVPKTYRVKEGREISERFRDWFRGGLEGR